MGIIDVQNFSTTDSDATVKKWVDAVKIQCDRDVVPIWGKSVNFNIIPKGGTPTKGNWQCGFFDNSDTAGALGWHDVGPNNEPIIKCFTKTAEGFGESPSVTLSHEVIECIGDADANTTVKGFDGNGKPALLFQELCDMVESSLYAINGVQVSDFVSPAWFAEPDKSGVFDFLKVTKKAWELASGGYEEVSYDNGNTWDQIDKASTRSHLGSHRKAVYHKKPEDRVKSTFEMSA
jgi:hypothetical protein